MGGVNKRYSWVYEGMVSYLFVCTMSTCRVSPYRNCERDVKSVADNDYGLENRKWEELTKDIRE